MKLITKDDLYYLFPVAVQNLLISIYGKQLFSKRYSEPFELILNQIEGSEKLSLEKCQKLQFNRLLNILVNAEKFVPYYHRLFDEHSISLTDINSLRDIDKIPVLEKEQFREQYEMFKSTNPSDETYFVQKTSGSSGKPLEIDVNEETYKYAMASLVNHEKINGVDFGEPRATFAGRMIKKIDDNSPPFSRLNKAENQMLFSAYHINGKNIDYYITELNEFSPKEIIGYPSAIYSLAFEVNKSLKKLNFKPKVIVTNSETLLDWQREVIEKVFQCPVRDYYGTAEYVFFARQCKCLNYHINPLMGILEVVDSDNRLFYDQEGELLCNTLTNQNMPLIRYKVGDRAVMSSGSCDCGSSLPYLSKIVGRIDDYFLTSDGRKIGRLDHIYKNLVNIKEGQIIQNKINNCVLKIVMGDPVLGIDEAALEDNLKQRVGDDIQITIEYVDEIKKGRNGKFKAVVNQLDS